MGAPAVQSPDGLHRALGVGVRPLRVLEVDHHRREQALGADPRGDGGEGPREAVAGVEALVERAVPVDAGERGEDRSPLLELVAQRHLALGQAVEEPVEGVVEADVVLLFRGGGDW